MYFIESSFWTLSGFKISTPGFIRCQSLCQEANRAAKANQMNRRS